MKQVMIFGVFDLLHSGHLHLFRYAMKFGELTIVLARDENVLREKGKKPLNKIKKRIENLRKIGLNAVAGDKEDYFKPLILLKPDIICLGYDQKEIEVLEKYKALFNVKIIRANRVNKKSINYLKGKVFSGFGRGKYYIKQYSNEIEKKFGFKPFHGTLNLKVGSERNDFLKKLKSTKILRFEKDGNKFGEVICYLVYTLDNQKCVIVIPEMSKYDKTILEIVSAVEFKKNIKDGQEFLLFS